MSFAPAYPHDPLEEIAPDLFMVRGCIRMNALMTITRNMAVVRHDGELNLVNPMRLDSDGEARLRELGEVRRILRLGPMHGVDDPYYKSEFGAELWAPGESESYPDPKPDLLLGGDTPLPFPDARFLPIEGAKQAEGALLIERDRGILLTCDAIQHYGDFSHNNLLAKLAMPLIGFRKTTLIGPIWMKVMTPEGASLEASFRKLLDHEFEHLLSAHGTYLRGGAHEAVAKAIDRAYA